MNTRPPRHAASGPVAERDWLAQEQALSSPGHRADALLARALASLPASQPPPGFAAEVAALAAAGPSPAAADARFERALLDGLLAVLLLATLATVAYFGGDWWRLARGALGDGAAQWALLGAACLLLSWLPEAARRLRETGQPVPGPA